MIRRGRLTGALQPVGPDFAETASHRLSIHRHVAADPSEVWDVLADLESWPDWFPAMTRSDPVGDTQGIGSTRWTRVDWIDFEETFCVWDPPRTMAYTVTRIGFPYPLKRCVEILTVAEASTGGSDITYAGGWDLTWWYWWLSPYVTWAQRHNWNKAMARLQKQLER